MSTAEIILEHLGGAKFLAMTGAKNLMSMESGLTFSLPKYAQLKINRVTITLNKNDCYDIHFGKSRGLKYTEIKTITDVYSYQLQDVFSENTGLSLTFNLGE